MENRSSKTEEKNLERPTDQSKTLANEQYKIISDKQSKSLCQIITKTSKGPGFLCRIPNPVLITNNHILNEDQIESGNGIKICFTDDNKNKTYKTIKIDEKKTNYTIGKLDGEDIDITIIELRPDEENLNNQKFLEIDKELMNDDIRSIYETKNIYLINYNERDKIDIFTGIISEIKQKDKSYTLLCTLNTGNGASGSPIILYNHKVIGLSIGLDSLTKFNKATLLQYPIKEFHRKLEEKKATNVNKSNNNIDKKSSVSDKKGNLNVINNEINEKAINDEKRDNKITMIYSIDKESNEIRIMGRDFVRNNNRSCKMIINNKEYEICDYIKYDKYNINKNDGFLTIILTDINKCTNASYMFYGCNKLQSLPDISNWDTENVTNMSFMFNDCSSLQTLPDTSKWDTKNVTNMSFMFCKCSSLRSLPGISEWNTKNVKKMNDMFGDCGSLRSLPDISKWNTNNVTDMNIMFTGCKELQFLPDISKWDIQNVTDIHGMFCGCISLSSLPDISKWDTKNVTSLNLMFCDCRSIQSLPDISKWNTRNVNNMYGMFTRCISLQSLPDITKWDTKNLKMKGCMFNDCIYLFNVPSQFK